MADLDLLAPVTRLAARIQEPIVEPEDIAAAEELLLSASDDARFHGRPSWVAGNCPPAVVNVVLAACQRAYQNPGLLGKERADAVNMERSTEGERTVAFTRDEIRRVRQAAGMSNGFTAIPASKPDRLVPTSFGRRGSTIYVPVDGGNERPFPWAVGP